MPLEMRKTSRWWYGRYNQDGKVRCVNLKLKINGKRPASMRMEGDRAFEVSRALAQEKFDAMLAKIRERRRSEEYVQELHEIRTGRRIESIPLGKLAEAWDAAPRKRKGSPRYVKQAHSLFERFAALIAREYPDAETLADITPDMAEAFMRAERTRGVSGRTCNATLILLRSAFRALANQANMVRNPFDGIPTVDESTTHRRPFTQDELDAILAAAADDDFIRPIIVTGMCTAMRRGDCCTLLWGDVDLDGGFVRVKTSKTGETVEIPLLAVLRAELMHLRSLLGKKAPPVDAFVFPEQARMYLQNPQGITWRVRKIFEKAGFFDDEDDEREEEKVPERELRDVPRGELTAAVNEMVAGLTDADGTPEKRARMADAFARYVQGASIKRVAAAMGMSSSSISLYLREIEDRTGLRVIPKKAERARKPRASVSTKPDGTARRVSVRDFHSFRVTWITLALSAGVPLELVQRVTGHKTAQIVLKHYFKPGRDAFKAAIEDAMPKVLSGPDDGTVIDVQAVEEPGIDAAAKLGEAAKVLSGVTGKANQARVERALELLKTVEDSLTRQPEVAQA